MNGKSFIFAPLFVASMGVLSMCAAHAGTFTVYGFSQARTPAVLQEAEALVLHGKTGRIDATCAGRVMHVSQTEDLGKVNAALVRECPQQLTVTLSSASTKPNSQTYSPMPRFLRYPASNTPGGGMPPFFMRPGDGRTRHDTGRRT